MRKLALVAMSGVRIVDDELRELGLTLPGFIERGKVIASLPSLGLLTVAAYTPPGWEIEYFEIDDLADTPESLLSFDAVAISSLTARIEDAYQVADRLRTNGVPVVLGGLHASVLADEASEHADIVVVGEGESAWSQALELIGTSGHILRAPPHHMTAADPVPRYDLLEVDRYNRIPLQTTRGCPLDCEFCAASHMISSYKKKPIQQVERELKAISAIWPKPFVELADDNTFLDRRWSLDLLSLLGSYGVRWFTESDISLADRPELLAKLADSGCAQVLVGLESASPTSLEGIDRGNWKRRQIQFYREKIDRIQQAGVSVNGCFVLGLDGDDESCFENTFDFVRELNLSEVQVTIMTPFPGTRLQARLRSEGRLLKERYWDQCTLFDVTYRPRNITVDQLREGFRDLVEALYSPTETARRKASFIHTLRQRR